jgi:hypothetical protein
VGTRKLAGAHSIKHLRDSPGNEQTCHFAIDAQMLSISSNLAPENNGGGNEMQRKTATAIASSKLFKAAADDSIVAKE